MSEYQNGSGYDYGHSNKDKDKVNDSISIGNFLWLATPKGVVKINQTTRERSKYTKEDSNLPSDNVESIAANQKADIWIGTYGNRMAFMSEAGKWKHVPYDIDLFKKYEGTIEEDGKILLGGKKDNWLRTNFIHFDVNNILWVGTSIGLLKLQYEEEKATWDGPFNPNAETDGPLNVLFIGDVEGGIEISGNYGKRGYERPIGETKTYLLPNLISAEDSNWLAMVAEDTVVEDTAEEEVVTEDTV